MTTASFSPEISRKISAARQLSDRAYEDSLSPWRNFAQLLRSRAETHADEPYLIYRDKDTQTRVAYSYHDFFQRCCRIANSLQDELGLRAGDRLGTVAYNHADTVALYYAAWMLGAVVVPFNAGDSDDRLVYSFSNAEVKAVFAMPDLADRVVALRDQLPARHYVLIHGEGREDFLHLSQLEAAASTAFTGDEAVTQDTEALIIYTSGTTGQPKGVVLEQRQILVDTQAIAEWYGFTPADRAMNVLPIHHVNGIIVTLTTPLYAGGSTVVNRKFSASGYWATVAEEGCTWGSTVPTVLSFLCEAKESVEGHDISCYKFVICGAGPLTVELVKRFENTFPVKIIHGYGLSESTCYSCYLPCDLPEGERRDWLTAYGYPAIGVALPCNEMAIHSPEGEDLPPEARGEIVIRGQNIMQGYFKRPDANAETFAHNWFRSGDEGFYKLDAKGRKFFFITGRLKELIIRGGINYSPLEIDEVINSVPGVKAGMAVGFENNCYGEEIGAYVVLEDGASLSAADVIRGCAALPFAKRPKVVVFGDEFPVTATGKYQRLKLKPLFAEWKDSQFREEKEKSA